MVEVFAIQILSEKRYLELKDKMLSLLNKARQDRILRFVFQEDAQRSLLGDIMIRSIYIAVIFSGLIYFSKVSDEANEIANKILKILRITSVCYTLACVRKAPMKQLQ